MGRNGFATALSALLCIIVPCIVPAHAQEGTPSYGPRDAIFLAADAAPRTVPGRFLLLVKASDRAGDKVYLNSEKDYRDQRSLNIIIQPGAARALKARHGEDPDRFFLGKQIAVTGEAERVRILFVSHGAVTGKYYYQTHVVVRGADQIEIAPH